MKEKSSVLFKKHRAKFEKALMILLPASAVLISYLILAPQLRLLLSHLEAKEALQEKAPVASYTTPVPTPQNQNNSVLSLQNKDFDQCEPDILSLFFRASTGERDLLLVIIDENGDPVAGEIFDITLRSQNGDYHYRSTEAGRCYIVDLAPGTYTVSMQEKPGYRKAESISCEIKEQIVYQPIPDIEQFMEIVDISQMPSSEIKSDQPEAAYEVIPEIINTPQQLSELPVLDSMGHPVYTYSYPVGPNGFLLYRDSGLESDVLPVDENNDGVLDYGLRYVTEGSDPADPSSPEKGYYVSVTLFLEDNRPDPQFEILATPKTQSSDNAAGWRSHNGKTYYYDASGQAVTGLKNIDGKLYYFNQYGEKASQLGVDVSCYNGMVNWSAVKAQGIDFAIVRIGGRGWKSGLVYEDSMATEHLKGAAAAGLKVGAYFYSTAITPLEAVQEASMVLQRLNGMRLEMPVYIDMEHSGDYPNGRADNLGTAQRVDIINAFCKTITASGYAAGVYSGESLLSTEVDYHSIAQYSIWLANYTENNALPSYAHRYNIWQFTDRGLVSGMGSNVDLNVIYE